jgi:hypothetical protein
MSLTLAQIWVALLPVGQAPDPLGRDLPAQKVERRQAPESAYDIGQCVAARP